MADEKKLEEMKEELKAEQFGGDHDDGTEESHVALDPEDAEVD